MAILDLTGNPRKSHRLLSAGATRIAARIHFITPGRPVGLIESFNGKLRDECLNTSWFESLEQAKERVECWRRDHKEQRPHSSLGNVAPTQYAANLVRWATG